MKKLLSIFLLLFTNLSAEDFKLEKIVQGFDSPWSLTFIDNQNLLVTEKPGNIKFINLKEKKIKDISHNLNVLEDGQGGLLDILHNDSIVFVSYSENRSNGMSSTSVARAKLNTEKLNFKNIFQAQPPINSGYHFGSRLVIKNKHLYVTAGERGQGMIAQDPTNHGARGGDWFGTANFGENYGWKILGWGGTNYSGTKIGPKWKPGFTKAIKYWVPSIAVSAMTIYKGETFKEWNGEALITSLKDQSLRKIRFNKSNFIDEKILFKGDIGRIRDIKIHESGDLYLLSDKGELWRMYK